VKGEILYATQIGNNTSIAVQMTVLFSDVRFIEYSPLFSRGVLIYVAVLCIVCEINLYRAQ
jgi:hypothetical protein